MEQTITLTIPANWLQGRILDQNELRRALQMGLAQLRQQQSQAVGAEQIALALLDTGHVRHLAPAAEGERPNADRQEPPTLPGEPASEILIAQRRGEL